MRQLYLFIFFFLSQQAVYTHSKALYWTPYSGYGGLYYKDKAISSSIGASLISASYLHHSTFGINASSYNFSKYKKNNSLYKSWNNECLVQYKPLMFKKNLRAKTLQGYIQGGIWYAYSVDFRKEIQKYITFEGQGFIIGFGASYALGARVLIDLNWKGFIYVPIDFLREQKAMHPITHHQKISLGFSVRLF